MFKCKDDGKKSKKTIFQFTFFHQQSIYNTDMIRTSAHSPLKSLENFTKVNSRLSYYDIPAFYI